MNPLVAGGVALALAAVGSSALSISQALLRSDRTTVVDLDGAVTRLVLEVDSGDVRVVASRRAGAVVERRERWSFERPAVTEELEEGVLRVHADCASGLSWCDVSYVLQVPRGTDVLARTGSGSLEAEGTGDVQADTGSGEVQLTSVVGDVDVRSGSGEVTLDDVRGGGSVVARTGSGDITVTGAAVGRISGRTGSGDVELGFRTAPEEVLGRTGSGDVDVELPRGQAYAVTVRTGSGDQDVAVATDPSSPRTVDVETGSGDVAVVHPDGPRR